MNGAERVLLPSRKNLGIFSIVRKPAPSYDRVTKTGDKLLKTHQLSP